MTDTLGTWPFQRSSFLNTETETNPVVKTMSRDRALIERALSHKHMIETIERFEWKNLPPELPPDLIERVLYFRFKGALFKSDLERYMFLPFALKGEDAKTIDSYGRYVSITPVLFTGQWKLAGSGQGFDEDVEYMTDRSYDVIYDMPQDMDDSDDIEKAIKEQNADGKAVILTDSSLEVSQDYTPMEYLARPFNEQLTDILVLVNMDLIASAKMFYIVAKDEAQKEAIEAELANLDDRILNQGKRYVVISGGALELKELVGTVTKETARYFQSYQSIDNLRKGLIGEDNGGTFMKQEHTTQAETAVNTNSGCDPIKSNALRMRKDFCTIANKVFGLQLEVDLVQNESQPIVEEQGAQSKEREGVNNDSV